MASANLDAKLRTETGKGAARKLRAAKQVPAVIYGHHREPQSLAIDTREVERMLERVAFETTVIELNVGGTNARTLIREIQRHPFKRQILHIDFQELVAGEMVTVNVPLVLVGTSHGVRNEQGTLDQVLRELEIEVDPANIPNHIDVDVSGLGLNESIHVRDLKLPEGIKVLIDQDATICVVAPPRVEVEVAPVAAVAVEGETPTEPELIRKTKAEEEGTA
ncbi:MAG: 50S ribosomal protein L25/general stress protein Ctc [Gemmatimonadota bacterium]|nr:50S ribosomal protein L25/general stress protein Ctc [Gemmatimonadota bacterium]